MPNKPKLISKRYVLIVLAIGIVVTTIAVLFISFALTQQNWKAYHSRFQGYSPSDTIKLGVLPDSTEEGKRAKENLISCNRSLIIQETIGGTTVAIEGATLGFCRMAIVYGIETPTALDCLVYPMSTQKWQNQEYGYSTVLNEIIRNSCRNTGLG